MAVEGLLKILAKMLCHSFFRILLHLVVDCRIDSQTILVKIVFRTVRLGILVQPAVKSIVCPEKRVNHIVLILVV